MQFKDQKALGQEACISLTNQRRLLVLAELCPEALMVTAVVSVAAGGILSSSGDVGSRGVAG